MNSQYPTAYMPRMFTVYRDDSHDMGEDDAEIRRRRPPISGCTVISRHLEYMPNPRSEMPYDKFLRELRK